MYSLEMSRLPQPLIKPYKLPPLLKPGDLIIVIAPSGALKKTDTLVKGIEIWQKRGYRVELGGNYHLRCGYLAGSDLQRREDLTSAWSNPECKAIVAVRGGYGAARLLESWNWQEISTKNSNISQSSLSVSSPKWLIGFSDVTSLLWSLATENIASLHAPVLTSIALEPEWTISRMFNYLETGKMKTLQGRLGVGKKATGLLLPANLTVATHLLNTYLQPNLNGVILAFEDVTEYPYRIDRMLTQWRMSGALKQVKGIALGRFSRCEPYPGTNSWSIAEVLRDRLEDLGIPIVYDLPFGHDGPNAALPVGQPVTLDGQTGILSWQVNSGKISNID